MIVLASEALPKNFDQYYNKKSCFVSLKMVKRFRDWTSRV